MAAGTAYAKRYGGGFLDTPNLTTPVDSAFLNAVETALLQLIGAAPTVDGQVAQWDNVNSRFGPALLLNKNIDAAAAIAKSKLDLTGANGIVDADVSGTAAIARSKLNFGSGLVNADIAAAAAIVASKISGGVAMQLICDSTLGGTAASFDTNTILGGNIPQTYSHLKLYFVIKTDNAVVSQNNLLRFNNDSGANYDWVYSQVVNNATTLSTNVGQTSLGFVLGTGATATAAHFVSGHIDVPNYSATVPQKDAFGMLSYDADGTAPNFGMRQISGHWLSAAAITRVALIANGGNFIAGSRFSLYGVL